MALLGLGLAGGLAGGVLADTTPTPTTTTAPTTTAPTTTTTPAAVVPDGVTVDGVDVGGLSPEDALAAVQPVFSQPLHVVIGKTRLAPSRVQLGAVDYLKGAITKAKSASSGTDVRVLTAVNGAAVRSYVA